MYFVDAYRGQSFGRGPFVLTRSEAKSAQRAGNEVCSPCVRNKGARLRQLGKATFWGASGAALAVGTVWLAFGKGYQIPAALGLFLVGGCFDLSAEEAKKAFAPAVPSAPVAKDLTASTVEPK